ncbi:hypothetical protein F66182_11353, partial [Fusarium sp. NRRL 66182]
EAFIAASTEAERTKLADLSSETSDWLYADGAEATKDVLKSKLKTLKDLVAPIQKRVEETEKRPELIAGLKDALDKTSDFVDKVKEQIAKYENWHKSASESASASSSIESSSTETAAEKPSGDFDGLEDEDTAATARKMEDVVKEKGPVPPVYTLEDLKDVIDVHKSTQDWLSELEPKQAKLTPVEDPVLLAKDLKAKRDKLEKAGIEVAVKAARKMEEMNKQAKKAAKEAKKSAKSKKTKTTSADPWQETLNFNPADYIKDGKIDEEKFEQLVKELNGEDDKKAEEDKKQTHDEL